MNWVKIAGGYFGALVVLILLFLAISSLVDGLEAMQFIMPSLAATFPLAAFVKERRRVPTSTERWQMLGACYLIFFLVQVIQIGIVTAIVPDTMFDVVDFFGPGTLAAIVLGTMVAEFGVMWVTFRFYPGMALKGQLRTEQRRS